MVRLTLTGWLPLKAMACEDRFEVSAAVSVQQDGAAFCGNHFKNQIENLRLQLFQVANGCARCG